MKAKTVGIVVPVVIILSLLVVWGACRRNQENPRETTTRNMEALGQAQSVYANDVDQTFEVQDRQLSNETFGGDEMSMDSTFYSFTMNDIDGKPVSLSAYRGKVVLVVNVASKCGFTKQYEPLQQLYETYKEQGFVILGFPANNFMRQEPGTDAEIKTFCTRQFQVTFPMFSKISVKGKDICPLYEYLTSPEENGEFGVPIQWNFNKFLIDREGITRGYFKSKVDPFDPELIDVLETALKAQL